MPLEPYTREGPITRSSRHPGAAFALLGHLLWVKSCAIAQLLWMGRGSTHL
jgi:hypothetical protein